MLEKIAEERNPSVESSIADVGFLKPIVDRFSFFFTFTPAEGAASGSGAGATAGRAAVAPTVAFLKDQLARGKANSEMTTSLKTFIWLVPSRELESVQDLIQKCCAATASTSAAAPAVRKKIPSKKAVKDESKKDSADAQAAALFD